MQNEIFNPKDVQLQQLINISTQELINLLGWQSFPTGRWIAKNIFRVGVRRFVRHADQYNHGIEKYGWAKANQYAAQKYMQSLDLYGKEYIPPSGPILIASNHPSLYDFMAISAAADRDDLTILAYTRPFLHALPNVSAHIFHLSTDKNQRTQTLVKLIHWLKDGKAVLTFPAGVCEPDPKVMPGATLSLEKWQENLWMIARKVPDIQIIPTLVSGVMSSRILNSVFVQHIPTLHQRIRVASTLQVMWQTITGRPLVSVRVDFSKPLTGEELLQSQNSWQINLTILAQMRSLVFQIQPAYTQVGKQYKSKINSLP